MKSTLEVVRMDNNPTNAETYIFEWWDGESHYVVTGTEGAIKNLRQKFDTHAYDKLAEQISEDVDNEILDQLIIRDLLGESGEQRIEKLMSLRDGWDFGRGKRITKESKLRLYEFLQRYEEYLGEFQIYIFATSTGHFELMLSYDHNEIIDIECFDDGYEVFLFAAVCEEDECKRFQLDQIEKLDECLIPILKFERKPWLSQINDAQRNPKE